MSMHASFGKSGGMSQHRNVLTRIERLERLKAINLWAEGKKVQGLPKVGNRKPKAK